MRLSRQTTLVLVQMAALYIIAFVPMPTSGRTLPGTSRRNLGPAMQPRSTAMPVPDHVVIVIEENHQYSQIIDDSCCSYINLQASTGAVMTQSFALTHPSQPNYLDLFSGSNQGVTDDTCPPPVSPYSAPNLGEQLVSAGLTFAGYSEDLPSVGSTICNSGNYARKHNPWIDFLNVAASDNLPFTNFPSDYAQLPTVSFVVPNLCNDMHNCSPSVGDAWLAMNMDGYIQWAKTHDSLFILTFDEDDGNGSNQIPTLFEGPMVAAGRYNETINHYNLLRTIEDLYGLPYAGNATNVATITDIWSASTVSDIFLPLVRR